MEKILIQLWIAFAIIYASRIFIWKRIVDNIENSKDKNSLLKDFKSVLYMQTFPDKFEINTKGLIWRNAYNKLTILIWVLLFVNVVVFFFNEYIVIS